jgi:hypothetical protein
MVQLQVHEDQRLAHELDVRRGVVEVAFTQPKLGPLLQRSLDQDGDWLEADHTRAGVVAIARR